MRVSGGIVVITGLVVVGGIVMHQRARLRHQDAGDPAGPEGPSAAVEFTAVDVPVARPPAVTATSLPPEVTTMLPPESPREKRQLMDEQVRKLRAYALEAGPDDPFALSPEEIEAFREVGEPTVW